MSRQPNYRTKPDAKRERIITFAGPHRRRFLDQILNARSRFVGSQKTRFTTGDQSAVVVRWVGR